MKVTKEDLPAREVLLNIEVDVADMGPYLERAYHRVVQRVNIPGFRRGKAPRPVVERFVGQEALLDEAVEFLVPEVVEQAIGQEKLEQAGQPRVEVVQTDPVVLKATVPLVPDVVLDAYRDIRVLLETVEVTDEDVQEVLEHLRWEQAPWEPVERPVALGDQVTLDVRAVVGGREASNQRGIVYLVTEENPAPVPGFARELVGMEPEGEKEFIITVSSSYTDQSLAGQECTFQVTSHQVKEKRVPELNDEFAKGVGSGYDSLEILNNKLRSDIFASKEQEARHRDDDRIIEQLAARTTIEMSPLLVDHEIDHLLSDEQDALKRQQVGMEQYLQSVGKSEQEHRDEVRGVAVDRMTRSYAIHKVAELEGLTASSEEIEEDMKALLNGVGPQADTLRRSLDTPDGRESLARAIVRRKALDRLADIARGEQSMSMTPAVQEPTEESSSEGAQDAGRT